MALSTGPASTWIRNLDLPTRLFESGSSDFELYEEDGEFVLTVELPGFEREEIDLAWDDGVLNISAEHDDERGRQRTYHRRFRFPKDVDHEGITAEYRNGVLEIRLPVADPMTRGTEIEVQG